MMELWWAKNSRENDSSCSIEPHLHSGQLDTACITANIAKVKDIALILLKVFLSQYDFVLSQESFCGSDLLHTFRLQPFNEMLTFPLL